MNLSGNAFGVLQQVFAAGGGFGLLLIIKVAVVVVVIGKASLVSSGVLANSPQELIGLLKLLLLGSNKLVATTKADGQPLLPDIKQL